jgi:pyruvate dehydrogenase E1 component alpha subunit
MASQARQRRTAPQAAPGERDAQLREFYRDMVLVRRFEERAARAYTEALIGSG